MTMSDLNWQRIWQYFKVNSILLVFFAIGGSPFANLIQSTGMNSLIKAAPITRQTRVEKTPVIRKISRTSDRLEGGAQVEIKGKNFTPDTVVVVGDAVATNTQVIKGKKIKFTVPPQKAPGMRTLSVWTPNGVAQKPFQIVPKKLEELADGEITTIAGGVEDLGDGNNPFQVMFNRPTRLAPDLQGNLYVTDTFSHRIRRIDNKTRIVTTIAGTGRQGFSGDGGPALAAQLFYPCGICLAPNGNVVFIDLGNQRIRQIDLKNGIISTIAGNGNKGFSGDNGPAQAATLSLGGLRSNLEGNGGITFDLTGNLLIADRNNNRIRRVNVQSGTIATIIGKSGEKFSGDGGPASEATISSPTNMAIDQKGNLFIADSGNNRIRRVDADTGIITTVAGNGAFGSSGDNGPALEAATEADSVTLDTNGNLFILDRFPRRIRRVDGKTNIISTVAGNGTTGSEIANDEELAINVGLGVQFDGGISIDPTGNLLIAESEQNRIRIVRLDRGVISTIAGGNFGNVGDGGPALQARFRFQPLANIIINVGENRRGEITFDQRGNMMLAEPGSHRVRWVDRQTWMVTTIAGSGIQGYSGDGQLAVNASFSIPSDVGTDPAGNIFIADFGNQRVRRVDTQTGIITTVAGNGSNRLNVDDDEDDPEYRFLDDNGPAVEASIPRPRGIAMDEAGNLFISHYGLFVRRVDAQTQIITTPLGCCAGSRFRSLSGIAVNSAGVIYVANAYRGILRLGPGETQPTVWFEEKPFFDVAVSPNGAMFGVVLTEHSVYQVEQRFGIRIAGGKFGYEGDNGPATEAAFSSPSAVAIDGANNLYIVDSGNNAVRVIKNGAR